MWICKKCNTLVLREASEKLLVKFVSACWTGKNYHFLGKYFWNFGNNLALSSKQQLNLQSWLNLSNGISLELIDYSKIKDYWIFENLLVALRCWTNPILSVSSSLSSEISTTIFSSFFNKCWGKRNSLQNYIKRKKNFKE